MCGRIPELLGGAYRKEERVRKYFKILVRKKEVLKDEILLLERLIILFGPRCIASVE